LQLLLYHAVAYCVMLCHAVSCCVMLCHAVPPVQDLLDCTIGDGCQGQYQTAYVNLIGCSGIALEADGPYRVADGGVDNCAPTKRYSGMAHGQGGEFGVACVGQVHSWAAWLVVKTCVLSS
jgi:hypothetical protein